VQAKQSEVVAADLFHAPENLEQLTERLRKASYLIDCGSSYGSGFGYSIYLGEEKHDFIITTKTVVTDCLDKNTNPVISDSDWNTFSAEVVASEKATGTSSSFAVNQDFAILQPAQTKIETFEEDADSLPIGSWVMSGSFPELNADYYTWTVTHSTLASNLHNLGYAISTPTPPGSNGGVVVNSKGEVLGIRYTPNSSSLEGFSHILPFRQATPLLDQVRELLAELESEPKLG
jgi:S1-C subfamily serine protease